ncbi:hypothetical protein NHG32_00220 [Aerococcaceae bacterium NML191219]|nr:hypothetical protein [Aerococcaceae bacterium NML191219]
MMVQMDTTKNSLSEFKGWLVRMLTLLLVANGLQILIASMLGLKFYKLMFWAWLIAWVLVDVVRKFAKETPKTLELLHSIKGVTLVLGVLQLWDLIARIVVLRHTPASTNDFYLLALFGVQVVLYAVVAYRSRQMFKQLQVAQQEEGQQL